MDIPKGKTRPEIKVKGLSYNETVEHAARSYESTLAVFQLTDILSKSVKESSGPKKQRDKNQNSFSRVLRMRYKNIRLVVGYQKSKGEYVQYSIAAQSTEGDKTK